MMTTTSTDVRRLLGDAEAFLRSGDPDGATARARAAARGAAAVGHRDDAEIAEHAELALDRFNAAEEAARLEIERRRAVYVANERRAAGIRDVALS